VGLAYRHRLNLGYRLPVSVDITEVGRLDVLVDGVSLHTPSQLDLGVGWDSGPPDEPGFSVEVGASLALWSDAPPTGARFRLTIDDRYARPPTDPQDDVVAIVDNVAEPIPLGARDTLSVRLGGEWRIDGVWAVRAGYAYRPTPLPRPVFEANAVDNDAHVIGLGGGVTFGDPTGASAGPVHLDVGVQLGILERRSVRKDLEFGRPQGAFEASGLTWVFAIDLRHDHF
jgi:long-subunit fatty acid transport protein